MKIKEQFKKKRNIYFFNSLVPLFVWGEFMLLMYRNASEKNKHEMYMIGIGIAVVILIILSIHIITNHLFWKKINVLIKDDKNAFDGKYLRIDRYLINEKFLLEYGMFRKRVIYMGELEKAELSSYQTDTNLRYLGKTSFITSVIILSRKGKKQIVIKAPVNLFGNEKQDMINAINNAVAGKEIDEKTRIFYETFLYQVPFYGILSICIIPVMKALILLYPYIRDLFVINSNKIKTILFCISYEARMEIIVLAIMCIFLGAMFYWKYCMIGLDFETGKHYFVVIGIGLIVMFLKFLLPWDYSSYKNEFQADYRDYKNANYEVIETGLVLTEENCYGWDKRMQDIVERYNINITKLYSGERKESFYLIDNNFELDKETIYQVKYLPNSKIVIEIQEVEETLEKYDDTSM